MLRPFGDYSAVYVEITKSEHHHGGAGWEFGTCLWSPSRNRAGVDRYALMRDPQRGDLVLHFYEDTWPDGVTETRLCGRSLVARAFETVDAEPPSAGTWSNMAPYYRIALEDYGSFPHPVALSTIVREYGDELLNDLRENAPKYYPFNTYGPSIRTVQGIYLARCTPDLYSVFRQALSISDADAGQVVPVEGSGHLEFAEARRLAKERYFFARNPQLARIAKERLGTVCQACGFDFGAKYGDLGDGYAEVHHLSPLSERPEEDWTDGVTTNLDQVAVLCANCHRVIHRQRPALSLDELRNALARQMLVRGPAV